MVIKNEDNETDPASLVPGTPPNYARYVVEHIQTFQGMSTSSAMVYRDYDEAIKDSLDNARFMRNDCGIMECLEARQRGVALLNWHLEPEDPDSLDQKALCDELEKIIRKIPRFTEYRRCLQEAIWYGKYAIQHRYGYVMVNGRQRITTKPIGENDGWTPLNGDKLVVRFPSETASPEQRPYQLGIRVRSSMASGSLVSGRWPVEPTDRGMAYFLSDFERKLLCVHKHSIEDGAYEDVLSAGSILGVGVRSRIYWDWMQKQESLGFLVDYLERAAGGIEIWRYPQGNMEAKKEAEDAIKHRSANRRSAWLVPIPPGEDGAQYEVSTIEPGLQGIETVQDLLTDYYGHRIKRYILGQTLTTEAASTGLGSGVADVHLDSFMQIVKYDATNQEESITKDVVTPLKNWNMPSARGISVRFVIDTEDPDVQQKLESLETAWNMGARIKESDVLDAAGVSVPTDEDQVLQNPQLMQQLPGGMVPGGSPAKGRSQGTVPENLDTSIEGMTNNVMQKLNAEIPSDQPSMYVSEGGEWREREIPDPELDTGDRHKINQYGKGWEDQPREPAGTSRGGQFARTTISITDATNNPKPTTRKEALDELSKLRGVYKNQDTGWEIHVFKDAIQDSVYRHSRDWSVMFSMPELIQTSIRMQDGPRRDGSPSHHLFAPVKVGEHVLLVRLTVVERRPHDMEIVEYRLRNLAPMKREKLVSKRAGEADGSASVSQADESSFSIDDFKSQVKKILKKHGDPGSIVPENRTGKEDYARKKKPLPGQQDFQWITIGGEPDGEKHHAGGTPVQIQKSTGEIVKGPENLTGKKVDELSERKSQDKPSVNDSRKDKQAEEGQSADNREPAEPHSENEADVENGPDTIPTQASLFAEDVGKGESPREAARKSERKDDPEYAFARQSAIGNAGEDLLGSARHIRNEWKSLEEAEKDGTAAEMVTRAMLLKNEPNNLLSLSEENPMTALAMHLVMNRFPNNPLPSSKRVKVDEETARKDRAQYLEAYRLIKDKAELLTETEKDPQKAIEKMSSYVVETIKKLRGIKGDNYMDRMNASDRYNNTANNLVDLHNALASYKRRQKTHISNRVAELARALSAAGEDSGADDRHRKLVSVVQDLIEGSTTWTKAIGGESSARREYFNPADLYVGIAKREGGEDLSDITKDPNSSVDHVIDHFGVRGVQWGNSVTDEEREHHAARIAEAFTDLVDVLGIRPEDASLGGKLGLAVGARGRAGAVAHYEPDSAVINLTRKSGVGSLAHEWGHGFDHFLSDFGEKFKSDEESKSWERKDGKWVKKENSDSVLMAMDAVRKAWDESGFSKRLQSELRSQIDDGLIAPGKRDYWNSNVEKFARTFERYVQHKLESQGRKNTYLAGVETKAHKSGGLWPEDQEVESMAHAFDALFAVYRKSKGITQKYSRHDVMRYFRDQLDAAFAEARSL